MKAFISLFNSLSMHFMYLFCFFFFSFAGGSREEDTVVFAFRLAYRGGTNSSYEVIYINHWSWMQCLAPVGTEVEHFYLPVLEAA